jgi:hypothetical protein
MYTHLKTDRAESPGEDRQTIPVVPLKVRLFLVAVFVAGALVIIVPSFR